MQNRSWGGNGHGYGHWRLTGHGVCQCQPEWLGASVGKAASDSTRLSLYILFLSLLLFPSSVAIALALISCQWSFISDSHRSSFSSPQQLSRTLHDQYYLAHSHGQLQPRLRSSFRASYSFHHAGLSSGSRGVLREAR